MSVKLMFEGKEICTVPPESLTKERLPVHRFLVTSEGTWIRRIEFTSEVDLMPLFRSFPANYRVEFLEDCTGCQTDQPNQLAHMDPPNGCLYGP